MPKLSAIDASFLAGEVDPAVIARVDDVVRSNAAGRIRNGYVRSMGGVHTRPGMRVLAAIEGRGFDRIRDLPNASVRARTGPTAPGDNPTSLVRVDVPPTQIIVPWTADANPLIRINLGITLDPGTEIHVRLRLVAPPGTSLTLWWWELDSQADNRADVGRWRSGAGHDPQRGAVNDRILMVSSNQFQTFTHTVVSRASAIDIRAQRWQPAGGQVPGISGPFPSANPIEIENWGGTYEDIVGSGARPAARLLNASWIKGEDNLLALHGNQSTFIRDTNGVLTFNQFNWVRHTGFTDDQVRNMIATRSPDGVYLHSPLFGTFWPPRRVQGASGGSIEIRDTSVNYDNEIQRGGSSIGVLGSNDPPNALYAFQGRLMMAGTKNAPNTIWFSETGDRTEFREPDIEPPTGVPGQAGYRPGRPLLASDAFVVNEAGRPINQFVSIHGGLLLVFFGTDGISFLDRGFVSATDFGFKENSERGIKAGVPPVEIGTGRLVFVESHGQAVWLMTYANERQGYILSELSQVAPHLLNDPDDMVFYSGLADGGTAVLVVNRNGTIAVCAVQPEGEWHAWSLWSSGEVDTDGFGDILDIEPFKGQIWAMTRRGTLGKAVYIERFDTDVELDFCHRSVVADGADFGTHPYSASYLTWSAVAEMRDGSRRRFGMLPEGTNRNAMRRFTASEVFSGLPSVAGNADVVPDDGAEGWDPANVIAWQVGQPFTWEVETMPFVKRTAQGSAFTSPTKTQECFVSCIERVEDHFEIPADAQDALLRSAAYTINGDYLPPVPRLFAEPRPQRIGAQHVAYQHRFVNLIGWRSQNVIALRGQRPCIIASVSRTVVT